MESMQLITRLGISNRGVRSNCILDREYLSLKIAFLEIVCSCRDQLNELSIENRVTSN